MNLHHSLTLWTQLAVRSIRRLRQPLAPLSMHHHMAVQEDAQLAADMVQEHIQLVDLESPAREAPMRRLLPWEVSWIA